MTNPSGHTTARRNLAQRIERFLRAHALTDWQADQLLVAIECLEAGEFASGERIMMYVDKARIFEPIGYVPEAARDARQLLNRLQQVLAA